MKGGPWMRVLVLGVVLLVGCSGSDDGSVVTSPAADEVAATSPVTDAATGESDTPVVRAVDTDAAGYLAPMDPASVYIQALCSIDIAAAYASDQPLETAVELLRAIPTSTDAEVSELALIVAAFEAGADPSDPAVIDALVDAGAIVRARCR